MWIGNHSWDHPDRTTLTTAQMQSEINGTQGTISGNVGVTPKLFRPPYGATNAAVKAVANSYGLTQVTWDVDSGDWNGATTAQIVAKAATLKGGQVILMHDGLATTRAAIPQIASGLVSRNLCAGQISPSTGKAVAP
jgi:endo-1,4-beta-xylanase